MWVVGWLDEGRGRYREVMDKKGRRNGWVEG